MALWCLTHCMTETLPGTLQNRAREGSCAAKTRELSWGCTSKGTLSRCHVLVHALGSASAGHRGWHSPGPKPGHMWVLPHCRAKHQHTVGLRWVLCLSSVIWVCFGHLGGFWTMGICYPLPGLVFHFPWLMEGNLQTPP